MHAGPIMSSHDPCPCIMACHGRMHGFFFFFFFWCREVNLNISFGRGTDWMSDVTLGSRTLGRYRIVSLGVGDRRARSGHRAIIDVPFLASWVQWPVVRPAGHHLGALSRVLRSYVRPTGRDTVGSFQSTRRIGLPPYACPTFPFHKYSFFCVPKVFFFFHLPSTIVPRLEDSGRGKYLDFEGKKKEEKVLQPGIWSKTTKFQIIFLNICMLIYLKLVFDR